MLRRWTELLCNATGCDSRGEFRGWTLQQAEDNATLEGWTCGYSQHYCPDHQLQGERIIAELKSPTHPALTASRNRDYRRLRKWN